MHSRVPREYALVYQCGIANVFRLGGAELRRVLQHSFSYCELFCQGLAEAGYKVHVYHADVAGDAQVADWKEGPGEMFASGKRPPKRQPRA